MTDVKRNDFLRTVGIALVGTAVAGCLGCGESPTHYMPDIGATLRNAESIAALRARHVQVKLAREASGSSWADGRLRYDEVRAGYESAMTYLVLSLTEGFTDQRLQDLRERLHDAQNKLDVFVAWCGTVPDSGQIEGLPVFMGYFSFEEIMALVKWRSDATQERIDKLIAEIKECRWKTWDELYQEASPRK